MTSPRIIRALVALALASSACSSTDATQLVLVVDTDLSVPDQVDSISLDVTGPGGMRQRVNVDLSAGAVRPLSLGLRPSAEALSSGTLGPVQIVASAQRSGAPVVERRLTTSFLRDRSLLVQIMLSADCQGVSCAAERTCNQGECVATAVAANELPRFTGGIPGSRPTLDGGVPDGCTPSPEICNELDDDCDGVVDNGFDLSSSADDCGRCGHACAALTGVATGTCSAGSCVISCDTGFDDCDGDPDNGCEANLDTDPNHCSSCGVSCDFANASGSCVAGSCSLAACDAGFADCDGDGRNGCEIDLSAPTDCGRCGHDCAGATCQPSGFCEGEEIVGISAGSQHTCALRANGQATCWGLGSRGQLGTGVDMSSRVPVDVMSVPMDATQISAGNDQSCLVASGRPYCWGDNSGGQLGDGTTTERNTPTRVVGSALSSDVDQIGQGSGHTCALVLNPTGANRVYCWGTNRNGQLGDGTTMDSLRATAVDSGVFAGASPLRVSAGARHTCAALDSGEVFCWGRGSEGQLGGGGTTEKHIPTSVEATSGMALDLSGGSGSVDAASISLVSGAAYSCAKDVNGQVYCWGDNSRGQMGDGSTVPRTRAVAVMGLDDAVALSAGDAHVCALRMDGRVSCWGANSFGQLGDGTTTERNTPVDVMDLPADVVEVACGAAHLCMRTSGGAVYCLGLNAVGQLGDGSIENRGSPTPVMTLP